MNYTWAFNQQGIGAVVRSLFKTNERKRCVRTEGNFKKNEKKKQSGATWKQSDYALLDYASS